MFLWNMRRGNQVDICQLFPICIIYNQQCVSLVNDCHLILFTCYWHMSVPFRSYHYHTNSLMRERHEQVCYSMVDILLKLM